MGFSFASITFFGIFAANVLLKRRVRSSLEALQKSNEDYRVLVEVRIVSSYVLIRRKVALCYSFGKNFSIIGKELIGKPVVGTVVPDEEWQQGFGRYDCSYYSLRINTH